MQRYVSSLVCVGFFSAFLCLGLGVVADYGISYDEAWQRDYGFSALQYVNEHFPIHEEPISASPLLERQNRFHGPVYTILATYLELKLEPANLREAYVWRHRVGFILFWLAGIAVFGVGRSLGQHWLWGLLAALLLFATPRIFAHAFFNPKDLPNLAFYTYAGASLYFLARRPSWRWLLLHSLLCGLAIAMRLTSVVLPVCTLVVIAWQYLPQGRTVRAALQSIVYLGLTFLVTVAGWPTLWNNPFQRLVEAFATMSAFPWEGQMLVAGTMVSSTDLPLWYLPVWLGVTIPIGYQLLAYAGGLTLIRDIFLRLRSGAFWTPSPEELSVYVLAALGFGPILALIIANPVMYNGWRHSYFVYPFLLLLGIWWLAKYWQGGVRWRWYLAIALAVNILAVAVFMVRAHPHQQTYFNAIAGRSQFLKYNIDYWGLSYRQGFELLAQLDTRDSIYVEVAEFPGKLNHQLLPDSLRQRLRLTDDDDKADYYLTHYWYWHDWRDDYRKKRGWFSHPVVGTVYAGPNRILDIYQLKEAD